MQEVKINRKEEIVQRADRLLGKNPKYAKMLRDRINKHIRVNWMSENCFIQDKARTKVLFRVNEIQTIIAKVKDRLRRAGKPVRLNILKGRQFGITTEALCDAFFQVYHEDNLYAMIAAHKAESARKLFNKIKYMQQYAPSPEDTRRSNTKEIYFEESHARIEVATAGVDDLGRSETVSMFHWSETAFTDNAEAANNSIMQCVPEPEVDPYTSVVRESTANGVGDFFYNAYCDGIPLHEVMPDIVPYDTDLCVKLPKGKVGETLFISIFLPWNMFEEYQCDPPDGFVATDEELELVGIYGLTDRQLAWRRRTTKDKCSNDPDKFRQEYPLSDKEAFLHSGRPVFNQSALDMMRKRAKKPEFIGNLFDYTQHKRVIDSQMDSEVEFVPTPGGYLEVWKKPIPEQQYAIGADVSEGLDPDESNDPDAHSAAVIHVMSKQMVAKLSGRYDPDEYGRHVEMLGQWYNQALIGSEINHTCGGTVRSILKNLDYPNLYYREVWKEDLNKPTKELGWSTDKTTRGLLVSTGIEVVRSGDWWIPSFQTLDQLAAWIYDKTGKATHPSGGHDDDVMGWLITVMMAIEAAKDVMVSAKKIATTTGEDQPLGNFRPEMLAGGKSSAIDGDGGSYQGITTE